MRESFFADPGVLWIEDEGSFKLYRVAHFIMLLVPRLPQYMRVVALSPIFLLTQGVHLEALEVPLSLLLEAQAE